VIQSRVPDAGLGRKSTTNMSSKPPYKPSKQVPGTKEPKSLVPSNLEVINYNPRTKQPQSNLPAGAYNPYDRDRSDDDRREKRPKPDLRRLSDWIQATQKVKVLRMEDMEVTQDPISGPLTIKPPRK
jgi:hypothetical protein